MNRIMKKSITIFLMLLLSFSLSAKAKKTIVKKIKRTPRTEESLVSKSIVALSPSATEILYAIGAEDQIAAVSEFSDYPPEAAEKPVVGGFDGKTLSIETILSYKPDLVYLTDGMHNFLIEPLDEYGIKWYLSKATSIDAIRQEILDIGGLTGHGIEALAVTTQMEEKLNKIAELAESKKASEEEIVSIYYEVWNAPYMSAGSTSFINDIIVHAGAKNIFDDLEDAYPMVSEETIIARAPQVILLPAGNGFTADDVKARAGWENIPAVQNDRIYVIDDNLYSRPGPRIADVVVDLTELIK